MADATTAWQKQGSLTNGTHCSMSLESAQRHESSEQQYPSPQTPPRHALLRPNAAVAGRLLAARVTNDTHMPRSHASAEQTRSAPCAMRAKSLGNRTERDPIEAAKRLFPTAALHISTCHAT
eukprot:6172485-Pleurochrysis_carterae.AAC.1